LTNVAPCGCTTNPRSQIQSVSNSLTLFLPHVIPYTLKMEATRSSETSVYNKPTSHKRAFLSRRRRRNLASYTKSIYLFLRCDADEWGNV
jgi:hypothetical protein